MSGSSSGYQVTDGGVTRWQWWNDQPCGSISALPVSTAVGAFSLRCSAFADNARISTAGRKASALTALLRLNGSLAAAVTRVGRGNRSIGRSSRPGRSFPVRRVLWRVEYGTLTLLRCSYSAKMRPHSTGLFDAGAKKWARYLEDSTN